MGAKDNIEFIKEEISNEEKFLEQVIKVERFYKRYKKQILGGLTIVLVFSIGYWLYGLKKDYDLKVSNEAYLNLLKNPDSKKDLQTLKNKNPKLYLLFLFQEAMKNSNSNELKKIASKNIFPISNIAKYQSASILKDQKELQNYEYNQNALLKDIAILQEAFLFYKQNRFKEAKEKLDNISVNSLVYPYAKFLLHYGIKGSLK